MAYALAFLALLLVGTGYLVGSRRGRGRRAALEAELEERRHEVALLEDELLRASDRDPVTGLHQPQYFQEYLEREWRRASRSRRVVSVIMLAVDDFHAFHQRHGQTEGDAGLRSIADVLKSMIHRPGDVLARYGGLGTFGVVLGGTDAEGAQVLAERLRLAVEELQRPNPASTIGRCFTASLGVASAVPDRNAAWQDLDLIAAAERALARAEEAGRNRVVHDRNEAPANLN